MKWLIIENTNIADVKIFTVHVYWDIRIFQTRDYRELGK